MKIPVLGSKETIRKLQKAGFVIDHKTGSHVILFHSVLKGRVTVPYHSKDIKKKTMRSIIEQSGLTTEEFMKL